LCVCHNNNNVQIAAELLWRYIAETYHANTLHALSLCGNTNKNMIFLLKRFFGLCSLGFGVRFPLGGLCRGWFRKCVYTYLCL